MNIPVATISTKDKIKEMFLSGHILTSCGAAKDFVTADLRKYITTLKGEGLDIIDKWVNSEKGKRYKEYWLRRPEDGPGPEKKPVATSIHPVSLEVHNAACPYCDKTASRKNSLCDTHWEKFLEFERKEASNPKPVQQKLF